MKEKLDKFIYTNYYIYTIFGLTFISWLFGFINTNLPAIGLAFILLFAGYILITKKDTTPIIPVVLSCLFVINGNMNYENWPWWIAVLPFFLVVFLIIYLIKNKIKFQKNTLWLGFTLLAIASILPVFRIIFTSGIEAFDFAKGILSFGGILYLLVYLFFSNTIEGDKKEYLAHTLLSLGILIAFELFSKYIQVGDFNYAMENKQVMDLGWGIGNDAAIYLNMSICMAAYYLSNSQNVKKLLLNLCVFIFLIIGLIFTWSRSGWLQFAVMIIPLLFFILRKNKYAKQIIIAGGCAALAVLIFGIIKPDLFFEPIIKTFKKGLSLSGRTYLYDFAIEVFKTHPIIGGSAFPDVPYDVMINAGIDPTRIVVFHSIFFQTIATMGILGLIALVFNLFQIWKLLLKNFTKLRIFMIIMMVGSFVQSAIDNVYYMVVFMIVFMISLAIIERSDDRIEVIKYGEETL